MVEGLTDEAMAHRLTGAVGHEIVVCYGKKGVGYIQKRIAGFNGLAKNIPILTLVDFMDTRMACPPDWSMHGCLTGNRACFSEPWCVNWKVGCLRIVMALLSI